MKKLLFTLYIISIHSLLFAQVEPELIYQKEITYGNSDSARVRVGHIVAGNDNEVYVNSIYYNYIPSYRPYAILKKLSGSNFEVDWEIVDTNKVNHSLEQVNYSILKNNSNDSFWWITDKGDLSVKNHERQTLRKVNTSDTSFTSIADIDIYSAHTYWNDKLITGYRHRFENDSTLIRLRVIDSDGNESFVIDYTKETSIFNKNIIVEGNTLYFLALRTSWWSNNHSPKLNLVKYDLNEKKIISETEIYDSSRVSDVSHMSMDSNGNLTLAYTTRDTTTMVFRINPSNEIIWTKEFKFDKEPLLRKILVSEETNSLILLGYTPPFSTISGYAHRGMIAGINLSSGALAYYKEYNFREDGDFHSFIRDGVITPNGKLVIVGEFVNEEGAEKSKSYLAAFNLFEITSVENEETLPVLYSLEQNYPNPFNPSTTISYTLPEESKITISIFNALGEEVQTMFSSVD